jgi:hypothetical protein
MYLFLELQVFIFPNMIKYKFFSIFVMLLKW